MPWKKWTRERLPVADLQSLQDQTVLHFPSASAADAAVALADRTDGMVRWLDDVERAEYWDLDAGAWRYTWGTPPPPEKLPLRSAVFYAWAVKYASAEELPQVHLFGSGARLSGMIGATASFGAASTCVDVGGIPAGMRPPRPVRRLARYSSAGYFHLDVNPDGSVVITPGSPTPIAVDTPIYLDATWALSSPPA